jgi:hypothetical protein
MYCLDAPPKPQEPKSDEFASRNQCIPETRRRRVSSRLFVLLTSKARTSDKTSPRPRLRLQAFKQKAFERSTSHIKY